MRLTCARRPNQSLLCITFGQYLLNTIIHGLLVSCKTVQTRQVHHQSTYLPIHIHYLKHKELSQDHLKLVDKTSQVSTVVDNLNEDFAIAKVQQKESIELLRNKIITMEFEMAYYAVDYPISNKHSHYTEHEKISHHSDRSRTRRSGFITDATSSLTQIS